MPATFCVQEFFGHIESFDMENFVHGYFVDWNLLYLEFCVHLKFEILYLKYKWKYVQWKKVYPEMFVIETFVHGKLCTKNLKYT